MGGSSPLWVVSFLGCWPGSVRKWAKEEASFIERTYTYYCCELTYESELVSMEGLHFAEAKEKWREEGIVKMSLSRGDCNQDVKEINI